MRQSFRCLVLAAPPWDGAAADDNDDEERSAETGDESDDQRDVEAGRDVLETAAVIASVADVGLRQHDSVSFTIYNYTDCVDL